ncbi:lipid A biosynthesis acyltransferase [Acinetobacter junii]|uniref:lysophospholipid acyltransferase family protein n=1 Tax=Acinetobacter junii TaxID=40215 RepID=UPI000F7F582B|nr:lysophospholipid acyltransferase family protein [Acinetobacter junii]RTE47247.1 lipid A biosynthesis acyltransferase [Acinetobacter junii]
MSFYTTLLRILPLAFLRSIAKVVAYFINQNPNKSMLWKTRVNLSLAYPDIPEREREREKLAKESVTKQCLSYIESGKCWAMPPEWSIQQIRTVHNLEVLTNALSDPRGALIITPHLGTWEMMNAWVHQYGIPTIMYKPMKDSGFNAFALHARQRLNATLVPTDANGVKALFKNLKQGGFSVILPDHVPQPSGGVVVPFFGIPCLTSTLASKMAQKTQCRLVGLSCFRREDGEGFEVYCDDLNDPELYDRDIEVATTALNKAVEQMINRFPTEYMWGYKRFRGDYQKDYYR